MSSWKPSRLSKFPDHTFHQDAAELICTFSEIPARRPTEQWHISGHQSGVQITLVMAKSKITPMKLQTTSRLEHLASFVAARLSHFIAEKLKPKLGHMETTLWSVLHWLCSKKLPDSFVSKRIEEIKKLTSQHQWRYCPSASNPADRLSRGVAVGA